MVPLRGLGGDGGEGDANFRREISAMMTVRRGLKLRRVFHVAAYEVGREPASRYIGDDTTAFGHPGGMSLAWRDAQRDRRGAVRCRMLEIQSGRPKFTDA